MRTRGLALFLVSCAGAGAPPPAAQDEVATATAAPLGIDVAEENRQAAANARCEGCHEEVAAEWRGSLHQRSWSDPVFLAAYSIEPLPFCRGCHAPAADPQKPPDPGARAMGVGCVTCHADLAAEPALAGPMPHRSRSTPGFDTAAACDGCHEFDFPRRKGARMQATLTEHRASQHAGTPCQTCHMKPKARAGGRSGKGHRFEVREDPALLRAAVEAAAAPRSDRSILVTLRAGAVGHAFPTGDLFRRIELRASAVGNAALRAPAVALQRVFRLEGTESGSSSRIEVRDERVPASGAPRVAVLVFPDSIEGQTIRWEVVYQRMGPTLAASFGVDLEQDEIVVATGTLRIPSPPASP
ncbi:multiheme c-type cytochrome [Polyangium sorediatum]|uniref:Multiheme c-type cytochrome n=1 Tax=Polyangium sorediatum TaxID=889274 RepID=A0ABT6P6C1_9BACT|nr:multiheme c-type cytochrome [Polyangium sorediatum]MDI1435857.1 multiheme c-type cytochrome [Polyangium sorediatum]